MRYTQNNCAGYEKKNTLIFPDFNHIFLLCMKTLLTEICKASATFFLLGAVVALGAPYFGAFAGLAPNVTAASAELGKFGDPILVGSYFASIGACDALLKPLFKKLFAVKPVAEKTSE